MKYSRNVWDKDALKNPNTEYQNLLGFLRKKQEFKMLFVRCSPTEGEQIIKRVKADTTNQIIHTLVLDHPVADFYEMFVERSDLHNANVLFVTGIEEFLESKVKDVADIELNKRLKHFPRPLAS